MQNVKPIMNKLPQITLAFWIMKICATTLGETAGERAQIKCSRRICWFGYRGNFFPITGYRCFERVTDIYVSPNQKQRRNEDQQKYFFVHALLAIQITSQ